MGSYYSGDHIAESNIHIDITTSNFDKLQQKYRFGTVSIRLLQIRIFMTLDRAKLV